MGIHLNIHSETSSTLQDMIVAISLILLVASLVSSRPASDQEGAMADAIKYLAELDNFYSEQVRPRFGKRSLDSMAHRNLERLINSYFENKKAESVLGQ